MIEFRYQGGKTRIQNGDRVIRVAVDDGAPLYVGAGEVVGFGRTRVYVKWDMVNYDVGLGDPPYHAVRTDPRWDYREAYVLRPE